MKSKKINILLWLSSILFITFSIRTLLLGVYKVSSVSMSPTLNSGDFVLSYKLAYIQKSPQINDVIIFSRPEKLGQSFIKRVVAGPGDEITLSKNKLKINQIECEYKELIKQSEFTIWHEMCLDANKSKLVRKIATANDQRLKLSTNIKFNLGPNEYYVMGDHRDTSEDSREWGPIKLEQIQGKVFILFLSWAATQDSKYELNSFWPTRVLTSIDYH